MGAWILSWYNKIILLILFLISLGNWKVSLFNSMKLSRDKNPIVWRYLWNSQSRINGCVYTWSCCARCAQPSGIIKDKHRDTRLADRYVCDEYFLFYFNLFFRCIASPADLIKLRFFFLQLIWNVSCILINNNIKKKLSWLDYIQST